MTFIYLFVESKYYEGALEIAQKTESHALHAKVLSLISRLTYVLTARSDLLVPISE